MPKAINIGFISTLLLFCANPFAFATAPALGGCSLFPDDAIFNVRIDDLQRFPRHPQSDLWISRLGNRALHLDFGRNENPDA